MNWTEKHIKNIIAELADENPLACHALFSITEIEFTEQVPTLAVTLQAKPRLLISKSFCDDHLSSENDLKAVLIHEFLHVLLGHTIKYESNDLFTNIATDAVINAIIHRRYGQQYSDFFTRFYSLPGITFLLRPPIENEKIISSESLGEKSVSILNTIHKKVYEGKICADDLTELLISLQKNKPTGNIAVVFIGDHNLKKDVSEANSILLDEILKKMDGTMIWSKGKRGQNGQINHETKAIESFKMSRWRKQTHDLLRRCLTKDNRSKYAQHTSTISLPVLNAGDKRSLAKYYLLKGIPIVKNYSTIFTPVGTASVYLDVSGSMHMEIDRLISLLFHFRSYIKHPIWTFSDEVFPASFFNGQLNYKTTSGTQIKCVFDHMRSNRIEKCIIITDGFIESIELEHLQGLNKDQIQFILSSEGSGHVLHTAGMTYQQLKSL